MFSVPKPVLASGFCSNVSILGMKYGIYGDNLDDTSLASKRTENDKRSNGRRRFQYSGGWQAISPYHASQTLVPSGSCLPSPGRFSRRKGQASLRVSWITHCLTSSLTQKAKRQHPDTIRECFKKVQKGVSVKSQTGCLQVSARNELCKESSGFASRRSR